MLCLTRIVPVGLLLLAGCASAGGSAGVHARLGHVRFDRTVTSWVERRDANVVRQQTDYSCGAAALATLMRHYHGDDVSEAQVLDAILKRLTPEARANRYEHGFTIEDLIIAATEDFHYVVQLLPVEPSAIPKLRDLRWPVLVLLVSRDYEHFTILRGSAGDRVFLADPSRGNIRMSADRFLDEWRELAPNNEPGRLVMSIAKSGVARPMSHSLALPLDASPQPEIVAARRGLPRY